MTALHIFAGTLALLAGYTAMLAMKGGLTHRRAGLIFVATMMVMGSSGAWMAALKSVRISVVAGLLVVYLVGTALLTVRSHSLGPRAARNSLLALAALGLLVATLGGYWGALGWLHPKHTLDGYPAPIYFTFGAMALVGVLLDVRLLRAGSITGKHRLARHLWRMHLAMYFAAASLFLGQARLFPQVLQQNEFLLALPVSLVVLHLVFWLWKTLRSGRVRQPQRGQAGAGRSTGIDLANQPPR